MNEQASNLIVLFMKRHTEKDETESLSKSVIYHSEHHNLIYDKARFIDEIISAHEWINISYERMLVKGYEAMKVYEKLGHKTKRMTFVKTTWISSCKMTLVFASNLRELEYDRNLISKTLVHVATRKQMCQIERRFEEYLLEYNSIDVNQSKLNNSIVNDSLNSFNWFSKASFSDEHWIKESSIDSFSWFSKTWFNDEH